MIAALCTLVVRFSPEVEAEETAAYRDAAGNSGSGALSLR